MPSALAGIFRASTVVLLTALAPAAVAGEARFTHHDGLVSATFDATPAREAFDAIGRATGIEVVVPPSVSGVTLTLTVAALPFELFLRRVGEALNLGGFALVYGPSGVAQRLIMVDRAQEVEAPPLMPKKPGPPLTAARGFTQGGRAVAFLIPKTEGESAKLGTQGHAIVLQGPPAGMTRTAACDGQPGDYPIQPALVTDGTTAYVTSIVVCAAEAFSPGVTLTPAPVASVTATEGSP